MKKLSKVLAFIRCKVFRLHKWTSKVENDIDPVIDDNVDIWLQFMEYSALYCKDCGRVSNFSKNIINELKDKLDGDTEQG